MFVPATRTFTWTPGLAQVGSYTAAFSIRDGQATATTPVSIQVANVNQPPAITPSDSATVNENQTAVMTVTAADPDASTTDEDTELQFFNVSVADVDAGTVQVTLTVTNGTLTLSGVAGLSFSAGDGTGDATMTFSGSPAAVNAALNGLRYIPTANYGGSASLAVNVSDLGNTGTGGPSPPPTR